MKKKSDLRSGDIVELRNGIKYMVLLGVEHVGYKDLMINLLTGNWEGLHDYNDKLLHEQYMEYDIIKVCQHDYVGNNFIAHGLCEIEEGDTSKWTWEREEAKEMTVDEISKALGYKVKVVGANQ